MALRFIRLATAFISSECVAQDDGSSPALTITSDAHLLTLAGRAGIFKKPRLPGSAAVRA